MRGFYFLLVLINAFNCYSHETVLVFGAGGLQGSEYKIHVFSKLRELKHKIVLCEEEYNPLRKNLFDEGLIDDFLVSTPDNCEKNTQDILDRLSIKGITPQYTFSVREEWLKICANVGKALGLPHQNLLSYEISQSKNAAKMFLLHKGLVEKSTMKEISGTDLSLIEKITAPFFIRPCSGIRSEYAKKVCKIEDLTEYCSQIKKYGLCSQKFLIEEFIDGHEVDIDLVIHQNNLLYASVSDNFPVCSPYALETGQLSPSILSQAVQENLEEYAYRCASALGFDRGCLHVELILKKDGTIHFVELNGRPGGMYIPQWHEQIWGVDLIKAHFLTINGFTPEKYLLKRSPLKSLAQLCLKVGGVQQREEIKVFDVCLEREIDSKEQFGLWVDLPYCYTPQINGHKNLGHITVSGLNPIDALTKLRDFFAKNKILIKTDSGLSTTSIWPLLKFYQIVYGESNLTIRRIRESDIESYSHLLSDLTDRARGISWDEINRVGNITLVVVDRYNNKIVATGGLHFWHNPRLDRFSRNIYFQDLVVDQEYRSLGIGEYLFTAMVHEAGFLQGSKKSLACSQELVPFYKKFGLEPTAIYMTDYKPTSVETEDLYRKKIGDWLYGQRIIEAFITPNISNVLTVPYIEITPGDNLDHFFNCLEQELRKNDYFVKFSISDSDFNGTGIRGSNSSRSRKISFRGEDKASYLIKLRDLLRRHPERTATIIMQQSINQQYGCLVHAECSSSRTIIDLLWEPKVSNGRFLIWSNDDIISSEEIKVTQSHDYPVDLPLTGKRLIEISTEIYKKLAFHFKDIQSWAFEGFYDDQCRRLTLLQLRPTPPDRPLSKIRNTVGSFYETYFFWGDFQYVLHSLTGNVFEKSNIFIRDLENDTTICDPIIQKLIKGEHVLLIDLCRGFRLSHEPWFLPEPNLRSGYNFIYVPKIVISEYVGVPLILFSSGDKAYIKMSKSHLPKL